MDYTSEATVTNTTTYYVEGLDSETETWTRVAGSKAHTDDGGFYDALSAASYAADIKAQGRPVRVVEEIVMTARRTYPWK